MSELWSILILAIAVSVDGFSVGVAYGLRNIRISLLPLLIISGISTLTIFLSSSLGAVIANVLGFQYAKFLGGIILIAIGLWLVYTAYLKYNGGSVPEKKQNDRNLLFSLNIESLGIMIKILKKPVTADFDSSGTISYSEAIILGLALAMDALGAGFGAGLSGFSSILIPFAIGLSKFVFISSGVFCGQKLGNIVPDRFEIFPGVIIIILGIITVIS